MSPPCPLDLIYKVLEREIVRNVSYIKERCLIYFPSLVLVGSKCFSMAGQEGAHSQIMSRPVPFTKSDPHRTSVFRMYACFVKRRDKHNVYLSVDVFPLPLNQKDKHLVAFFLSLFCISFT